MKHTLLLLVCAFVLGAQTRIPLTVEYPNSVTVSPNGACLAFHPGTWAEGPNKQVIYLLDPTKREAPEKIPLKTVYVERMRCLDDGLWIQHTVSSTPKIVELARIDLVTKQVETILRDGSQTPTDIVRGLSGFTVDSLDPQKRFVFFGDGLYVLTPSGVREVFTKESLGIVEFTDRDFFVSGRRILFKGRLGRNIFDPMIMMQFDQETKSLNILGHVGEARTDGSIIADYFAQSGDLLAFASAKQVPQPPEAVIDGVTHIVHVEPGSILPEDIFRDTSREDAFTVPWPGRSTPAFLTEHSSWGEGTASVVSFSPVHTAWFSNGTELRSGDTLLGTVVKTIAPPVSSRDTIVLLLTEREEGINRIKGDLILLPIDQKTAPLFTRESIVNAASFVSGPIAPRTWTSIFGEHLISEEHAWRLRVDNVEVPLGRISLETSNQINFLTPDTLRPEAKISIVKFDADGFEDVRTEVTIPVAKYSPGLFQSIDENGEYQVIVTNNNPFFVVTKERPVGQSAPAAINLWGTGFTPDVSMEVALLNQSANVLWIGEVMPGLTQVNVLLPPGLSGTVLGEARIGSTFFPLRFYVEEVK